MGRRVLAPQIPTLNELPGKTTEFLEDLTEYTDIFELFQKHLLPNFLRCLVAYLTTVDLSSSSIEPEGPALGLERNLINVNILYENARAIDLTLSQELRNEPIDPLTPTQQHNAASFDEAIRTVDTAQRIYAPGYETAYALLGLARKFKTLLTCQEALSHKRGTLNSFIEKLSQATIEADTLNVLTLENDKIQKALKGCLKSYRASLLSLEDFRSQDVLEMLIEFHRHVAHYVPEDNGAAFDSSLQVEDLQTIKTKLEERKKKSVELCKQTQQDLDGSSNNMSALERKHRINPESEKVIIGLKRHGHFRDESEVEPEPPKKRSAFSPFNR
jgi:hypothetical protein